MFLNYVKFAHFMFHFTYDEIISRIREEKQLSDEEITKKIKTKLIQLSDLISKEGAAHIVAHELGVKLIDTPREIKVNRLIGGMNAVTIVGKVLHINDIVQFANNGREGKVVSFLLGDDTGTVRVVLWDTNHIKQVEEKIINEGVALKVQNGYVKVNGGYREVHVGNKGILEILPDVNIDVKGEPSYEFEKKAIRELNLGDTSVGVFGTVVQIFEPRFYESCSLCGKKLESVGEQASCREHGKVVQELVPIVNFFIDDGTDSVRAVAFRQQALFLLNTTKEDLLNTRENLQELAKLRDAVLGKQLLFIGRIIKNDFFGRNEMMIQRIIEVTPEDLINELEQEVPHGP